MKPFEVITGADLSRLFSHREKADEVAAAVNAILNERGKRVRGQLSFFHENEMVWGVPPQQSDTHEALLLGERLIMPNKD